MGIPIDVGKVGNILASVSPIGASEMVGSYLGSISSTASSLLGSAQAAIGRIGSPELNLELGDLTLPDLDFDLKDLLIPEAPAEPDISMDSGQLASADAVDFSGAEIEINEFNKSAPSVTARPPSIREPADPGDGPDPNLDLQLPDSPNLGVDDIIKKLDALVDTNIPSFSAPPLTSIPDFDATLAPMDIEAPGSIFAYSEERYVSELADKIKAKLLTVIENGGTGLSVEFEAALWDRGRDRLNDVHENRRNQVIERFAGLGWDMPAGAMEAGLKQADNERERTLENVNNDIMVENARLAQNNWQFSVAQGIALENVIADIWNRMRDRALAAAKAASENTERAFQLKLAAANYDLERYKTLAQVYEAKIRAAIAKLDQYRAGLEAQRIQAEIKKINGDLVISQIEAVRAAASVYETQVRAALSKVEVVRAQVGIYQARVDAYKAKWQGETARIGVYQAELAGDQTKADIFRSQVQAYQGYVAGKEAESRIKISNADLQIKGEQIGVEKQRNNVETYKARAGVSMAAAQASAQVYSSKVQGYSAAVGAEASKADAQARLLAAKGQQAVATAQIVQSNTEAKIQAAIQVYGIEIEKLKAMGNMYAQMSSSWASAIHVGASTSESYGKSYGVSYSHAESLSNAANLSEIHTFGEEG